MRIDPIHMQLWKKLEYKTRPRLIMQVDSSTKEPVGSFGQEPEGEKYWAYVLGFFVFHHSLAEFQLDVFRCKEIKQILFRATEALHLPKFQKWQDMPLEISGTVVFPMMLKLIRVLEGKYSEPLIWTAESGYWTGIVLASLVGQIETEDLEEVASNLVILQDMLVPALFAVEQSGYSWQLRQALQEIQKQLNIFGNRELAIHCKCILEPVIKRLLLDLGENCVYWA